MKTSTLRPGLLVSLKTSVTGNVKYAKRVLEGAHVVDGAEKARWETERTIMDKAEHEAASKARSKARSLVTSVCAYSAFGLLCPEADAADLDKALAEARKVADEFNTTAQLSRVSVYVITGRIAPDDVEAVKAINSEIKDLLTDMESGVKNLDVKAIREAANRAKEVSAMLSADSTARVQIAVEAARNAAKKIVKAGEQASAEVDLKAIRQITEARTAFLDLDEQGEVQAPEEQGRAIDLGAAAVVAPVAVESRALEVE